MTARTRIGNTTRAVPEEPRADRLRSENEARSDSVHRGVQRAGSPSPPSPPRPVTAAYLERAALYYLERYGASAEMLRRVLARRVEKRCRLRGEEAGAFAPMIEATVTRAVSAGLVDDDAFARAKVASLRRRGTSARLIAAKLSAKGVSREAVGAALAGDLSGDGVPAEAAEVAAARALARRRRLGRHRSTPVPPHDRAAQRARDLAVLARAGFAYDVARRVVDATADEDEAG